MVLTLRGIKPRYEVRNVIERGGMGVVYEAYDKIMKRPVALKTLLDLTDSRALQLFEKECDDLASLVHPNIVEIYDVGQLEDEGGTQPYLVMPLLPGVTLEKLIRSSSSRLTVERCVDIFSQTCRGLQAAHERGLIHRDLKPSNIFVMDDDSVKIIDFGVTSGRKGPLLYVSPEQIGRKPLTPASDIFSLGVVCYEALTLRRPFERSSENEIADAILKDIPPPVHELNPSIPMALSQAIHKAIAKDTRHRYRSAKEFGETLQKALRNEAIEIFHLNRLRPRLLQAREAYDKSDYDYASEIVGELESEGHLIPEISELRERIDRARVERRVSLLIEAARARMDEQEYQLALQKTDEALQLEPKNTEALALKAKIDTRRMDRDVDGWFGMARTHLENRAFGPAREALRRILEFRPREPKAAQLLSEVERLEQNDQRLKSEKERLYRAAVEAKRAGDLGSALSKLDRILDLDKEAPEPALTGKYQQEYEKIHSAHEALKAARSEARHLLDDQRFPQAVVVCEQYLAKYPGDTLLQALHWEIEEKHRQTVSARIAETDRRVEAEPDLDRHVSILEQAVSDSPGEVYFERALHNARDKRDGVNAIVSRARGYEERGQFSEALAQWEMLQAIYSRYPGLRLEIERLNKRGEQSRRLEAKARWVEQIDQEVDLGDFARAGELGQKALQEFPEDAELAELGRLAQKGLERRTEAQSLFAAGREAWVAGRFAEGLEHLRRAHELDGKDNQIRNVLVETLVEQGRRLMESDPGAADQLLHQALVLEPSQVLAIGLLSMLADQRKIETIDRALEQVKGHHASGEPRLALLVINDALAGYPNEERLLQVQNTLLRSFQGQQWREVDSANNLDDERRLQFAGPLPLVTARFGESGVGDSLSHHDRSGAARDTYRITSLLARRAWAGLRDLHRPWNSKELLIGAASAVGLLLVLGLAVQGLKPRAPKAHPVVIVPEGSVTITTVPAGATVSVDGEIAVSSAQGVTIRRHPGSYNLDVKLAGYQPVTQSLKIQSGNASLPIKLIPELPMFVVVGNSTVYFDADPASEAHDGRFQQQLTAAEHTVRVVMSRFSEVSFKVHVDAEGLPVVSDINAREMTPLIVNSFGPLTKLYSGSKTPVPVMMNGQKVGNLSLEGMDLPALAPNSYDLLIGAGKDAKIRTIEIGPARTITALLEADPNVGTLLIQTNEDGASVVLLSNGRELARKIAQNHQARFANLHAHAYGVQVSKDGYEGDGEKPVEVLKGTETPVVFALHRKVVPETVHVKTNPGADVFVDDERMGPAGPDGMLAISESRAGSHRVEARLKLYTSRAAAFMFEDGAAKTVELMLARDPGTVVIRRDPASSEVSYKRREETVEKTAAESQLTLPEGSYVFTAKAPGYLPHSASITVRSDETVTADLKLSAAARPVAVDAMQKYWEKGVWTQPQTRDWYVHKGDSFIGATRPGPAVIEFVAPLLAAGLLGNSRKLVWATNFVNNRNLVRYELNDKSLTITIVKDGKGVKSAPKAVKPVASYMIQLEWRLDSITVKINEETVTEIKGEFQAGKFGFLGNKEVRIQNFRLEAGT